MGAEFKVRLSGLGYPLSHFIIPVFVLEARFGVFTWLTWHLHVSQAGLPGVEMVGVDHSQSVRTFLSTVPSISVTDQAGKIEILDFGFWQKILRENGHVAVRLLISKPSISCRVYTLSLSSLPVLKIRTRED